MQAAMLLGPLLYDPRTAKTLPVKRAAHPKWIAKALRVLSGPPRENPLRANPEARSGDVGSSDPGLVSTNFASALTCWVNVLKRWQEDQVMSSMNHPPVQKALNMLRAMSADEIEQQFAQATCPRIRLEKYLN